MPRERQGDLFRDPPASPPPAPLPLAVTLSLARGHIRLSWSPAEAGAPLAELEIWCPETGALMWEWRKGDEVDAFSTSFHRSTIRARLRRFGKLHPIDERHVTVMAVGEERRGAEFVPSAPQPVAPPAGRTWAWIEAQIVKMVHSFRPVFIEPEAQRKAEHAYDFLAGGEHALDPLAVNFGQVLRREIRREERLIEEAERRDEQRARIEAERKRRLKVQREREGRRRQREQAKPAGGRAEGPVRPRAPLPSVPVAVEAPGFQFQEALVSGGTLRDFFLRERAALWWVSNQADDLLALPHCRIQRLEYQVRTALRVIGPLRGRALLSDEVGLGKTIEAGLVLKEYLTRGMIKRFLVLTVPSLVDQWEEELAEKFDLTVATTNQAAFRANPSAFWREQPAIVASLHTLKQAAHLEAARTVNWGLLIVDEAHYLRKQASLAWQAVNALPRQFLLLLTATPVQNSLEDLYNLVTLLQPGQLPSPKEFRARFIHKTKPHQPREPEELRRLLGQLMIRNTRANAGISLPPRRAETVLFEPAADERAFWEEWEREFRVKLAGMNAGQAALWGRLLLQSAGSSPAAWRRALTSFPDAAASSAWSRRAPLEGSWTRKCQSIVPLAKGEGGLVVFTQFLDTQAALAEELRRTAIPVFVINGSVPAPERQPIADAFRRSGGALILTQSGTEGRNLQFCHRLVNFDLPWNPMEIEQRIGRLHRIGQEHPVRIFNLVQAGTLQEHLLQILQDKLNLFELVVGETGLILGDRFSSDEFAEQVLRLWRESEGRVAEAMQSLGNELAAARQTYDEVRHLDETLFAHDYESL